LHLSSCFQLIRLNRRYTFFIQNKPKNHLFYAAENNNNLKKEEDDSGTIYEFDIPLDNDPLTAEHEITDVHHEEQDRSIWLHRNNPKTQSHFSIQKLIA